jgi:hypothetical protein
MRREGGQRVESGPAVAETALDPARMAQATRGKAARLRPVRRACQNARSEILAQDANAEAYSPWTGRRGADQDRRLFHPGVEPQPVPGAELSSGALAQKL